MIKGITVKLINKVQTGIDEFKKPIYTENITYVDNILISPSAHDDIVNELNLSGKKAVYTLAIPKGDNHVWEDSYVEFFNERFHVFTIASQGIERLIPLDWNKKVMVERYE